MSNYTSEDLMESKENLRNWITEMEETARDEFDWDMKYEED